MKYGSIFWSCCRINFVEGEYFMFFSGVKEREKGAGETRSGSGDIFNIWNSNCLKGIAIVLLLFHHCFLRPDRYEGHTLKLLFSEETLNYYANFGKICVSLFVLVSAYGLTKKMMSLERKSELPYWETSRQVVCARLVKLLGNFIFVFLGIVLVCRVLQPGLLSECYGTGFPENLEYFLMDMFGIAKFFGTPSLKGTFWYYGLAIFLILILPMLYWMLKRMGAFMFLAFIFLVNFNVSFSNKDIWHYFLCIGVGMVCAYTNFITRCVEFRFVESEGLNKMMKLVLECAAFLVLMVLRQGQLKGTLYPLWDAVIPVLTAVIGCEFIFALPLIGKLFHFLGVYSAGIFLIHNFIRTNWLNDFTYSFGYPALIVLVLLADSLVASILIENLKKVLHFDRFLNRIIGWIG